MWQNKCWLPKKEAGFTFFELMTTVGIVAILAAVAVPIYTRYITSAKAAESVTIIMALVEYAESYARSHPNDPFGGPLASDQDHSTPDGTDADGTSNDWVSEVVGNDNKYFNFSYSSTTHTIMAAGDGYPFSSTDTLVYDLDDQSWLATGKLKEVTPDHSAS